MAHRRCKLIPYWDNGESRWAWVPRENATRGETVELEGGRRWLIVDVDTLVCDDIANACLRDEPTG